MNARNWSIIVIVILVIAILGGYWYYSTKPKGPKEIRIGVIGPFTGPFSRTGEEMKRGSILAAEEINSQGGILGMNITLYFADSESKPEVGVSAAERLITHDHVDVIAGCYHSSVTLAVMDVAAEHKIPFVNALSLSEEIPKKIMTNPQKYKYVFHVELNSSAVAISEAKFIKDMLSKGYLVPKTHTFSVICEDTDYGRSAAKAFEDRVKKLGFKVASEDFYTLGTEDFSSILMKIKGLNPDFVYCAGGGTDAARLTIQYHDLGIKRMIIGESFTLFPEFYTLTGEKSIGLIDFIQTVTATPVGREFTKKYFEKYGEYPSYTAGAQYDNIMIVAQAIKRAKSLDPDAIVNALLKTDYRGFLSYRVVFNPKNHESIYGKNYRIYTAIQIQETGKVYVVWPFENAERKILITWSNTKTPS